MLQVMNYRDLGREIAALGTPGDRVKILDIDHSATTYQLPQIEQRVRIGAYYLRPPSGFTAQEMKEVFDKYERPAFRYKVTGGIGTDHVELLTPDEYAREYFSSSTKLIHIEGARRLAREQLEEIFDEMKARFDPHRFPHLDDVTISGHKEGSEELMAEVKLLAYEGDFRNLSQLERAITKHLSEGSLHREIFVSRHLVRETKPEIILSTTAKATAKGRQFLNDLAAYLLARDGGMQTEAVRAAPVVIEKSEATVYKSLTQAFPRSHVQLKAPAEIVAQAAREFQETLARMSSYKELEVKKMPQGVSVQFSKALLGGRRFEAKELREIEAVHRTILGSPGLHDGWSAYYYYDKKERVLKIRFTVPDERLESPWTRLGA
jgi:hypothetical protein